ncbi:MAG: hypothetical protein QOE99_2086 [Actinomycetota bacterium]|jgi:hypothetical protein|nr:hypothetical protein [Actinomycetota bacterium]
MNLFRSEEHIANWLGTRQPGATTSITVLSALANAWWSDRLAEDWRPHARQDNQAILDVLGLTGPFWQL